MLYILHFNEDGELKCEMIQRDKFDEWVKENTDGIRPECQPRFVDHKLNENSPYEYLVVEGKIIVPKPVTTVTSYSLE